MQLHVLEVDLLSHPEWPEKDADRDCRHEENGDPAHPYGSPVLGIAAFIPAWLTGAGIRAPGLSFITPLSAPLSYMGPAAGIWMVIGIIYLVYLYMRHRQRIMDVALIHLDEAPAVMPDPRVAQ